MNVLLLELGEISGATDGSAPQWRGSEQSQVLTLVLTPLALSMIVTDG